MPVEVEQTARITEAESVALDGVALELSILHEHEDSHATLQPHRAGGIAICAVQAGFALVAQGAADDVARLVVADIVHGSTAAYAQHGFVVAATGDGHGAFTHLAPFLAGRGGELQSEIGAIEYFEPGAVEGVVCIGFCEFPSTVCNGDGTGAHVDAALQLQVLFVLVILR